MGEGVAKQMLKHCRPCNQCEGVCKHCEREVYSALKQPEVC